MLDLTPTAPAAYYERPAVDRMFRKVPPPGVCAGDPALSGARSRGGWTGYRSSGGCDDS
jgi:hypothetical protein